MREEPEKQALPLPVDARAAGKPRWLRRVAARLYRLVRGGLALAMLLHVVLVCTPLTEQLYIWLDASAPPEPADVIVCLGGSDDRLAWSAAMFHRGFAPKVVVSNQLGAAERMRDALVSCGVPPERVLVDAASATTADHPAHVAEAAGLDPATHRFLIVTDREHSRRVAACFRRAGYQRFSIYVGWHTLEEILAGPRRWRWRIRILPALVYEYTALVQYWFRGRI